MTYVEYMALREKIVDAMWERNVFPEQRADNIMKLVGIEYEEPKEEVKE
jgi:hypothetical protein